MQVTCTKCGRKVIVQPNNLKRNGTTPETYKCINCTRHTHNIVENPDYDTNRRLKRSGVLLNGGDKDGI